MEGVGQSLSMLYHNGWVLHCMLVDVVPPMVRCNVDDESNLEYVCQTFTDTDNLVFNRQR